MTSRRGIVIAVVSAGLVVAVGLTALALLPHGGVSHPSVFGSPPYQLGTPAESNDSFENIYRFSVIGGWDGVNWSQVSFAIQTASGGNVTTNAIFWTVGIYSANGSHQGFYDIQGWPHFWETQTRQVAADEYVQLTSPLGSPVSGDRFIAVVTLGGSVIVDIP